MIVVIVQLSIVAFAIFSIICAFKDFISASFSAGCWLDVAHFVKNVFGNLCCGLWKYDNFVGPCDSGQVSGLNCLRVIAGANFIAWRSCGDHIIWIAQRRACRVIRHRNGFMARLCRIDFGVFLVMSASFHVITCHRAIVQCCLRTFKIIWAFEDFISVSFIAGCRLDVAHCVKHVFWSFARWREFHCLAAPRRSVERYACRLMRHQDGFVARICCVDLPLAERRGRRGARMKFSQRFFSFQFQYWASRRRNC